MGNFLYVYYTSINIFLKDREKEKMEALFPPAKLSKKLSSEHHENYASLLQLIWETFLSSSFSFIHSRNKYLLSGE